MPEDKPSSLHYVDLVDGVLTATNADDLDDAVAAWRASPAPSRDHMVLHFHGGLINRKKGLAIMAGLEPIYSGAGAWPMFFVWHSGIGTAIFRNLDEIAQEKIFQRLLRKLAQLLVGKLVEAGGARGGALELPSMRDVPSDPAELAQYLDQVVAEGEAPLDDPAADLTALQRDQLDKELRNDVVIATESARIANYTMTEDERDALAATRGAGTVDVTPTKMSQSILDELRAEAPAPDARGVTAILTIARYGVKIALAVLDRMRKGRGHGLYTTIVEEVLRTLYVDQLGGLVWKMMKNDTADAFGPDPAQGGSALIARLRPALEDGARLTLVGHSTGAIYIGHFLDALDAAGVAPEVKVDVVFLAPACTFAFMDERLARFRARVRNFRMFGLDDTIESAYFEVPAYRGSLLYIVSGLFEDEVDAPIVGMRRYFDHADGPYATPALTRVSAYVSGASRVWSVSDGGVGKQSGAKKHGDFDDDPLTRQSLAHLLTNGFD